MFLRRLWQRWLNRPAAGSRARPAPPRRARLMVEPLEDRAVPASFTAASVTDLIGAITAASQSPEADTITLTPGKTFTLTSANNSDYGSTGLPTIAANGPLTIVGNGDVIERSTAKGTPAFRLLDVAPGASLTLENLTLQGGLAPANSYTALNEYYGHDPQGGAVYNLGTLTLRGVTVQNNVAQGSYGSAAWGGGIYSRGSLTVEGCTMHDQEQSSHRG